MYKPKIGITVGDINGIGPEIIIKSLHNKQLANQFIPIVYGDSKVLAFYKNILSEYNFQYQNISDISYAQIGKINLIKAWEKQVNIEFGKIDKDAGWCAIQSLEACTRDVKEGKIDAMVTAPIHKKSMHLADFPYLGHTSFLNKHSKTEAIMMLCSDQMRVVPYTGHIPLHQVPAQLSKDGLIDLIQRVIQNLKVDFAIEKPIIAVLGLNPHAGDDGIIGEEEKKIISPAIVHFKKNGDLVYGPYPADGFFGSSNYQKFDAVISMYHDQGLVGFKSLSFGKGVNLTSGMDFVRTSPDHGTGFDIAGKGIADPSSFMQAIYMAIDVFRNRSIHDQYQKIPPKKVDENIEAEA